jgi:type II secretory pathway component GspD/PulD (secretin)
VFSPLLLAQQDEGPPRLIACDVLIAVSEVPLDATQVDPSQLNERIDHLANEGKLVSRSRASLVTVENHPALLQLGEQTSVATGRIFGGRRAPQGGTASSGRTAGSFPAATSYTNVQTGTVIKLLPRVADDGAVLANVSVEQSRLRPSPTRASLDSGQPADAQFDVLQDTLDVQPPGVTTLAAQSEIRVPDGKTVILGSFVSESEEGYREAIVLLTARLVHISP